MQSSSNIFETTYNRWHRFIFYDRCVIAWYRLQNDIAHLYQIKFHIRPAANLLYLFTDKVGANPNIPIIAWFLKGLRFFYCYIFILYRRALGTRRKFWRTRYIREKTILCNIIRNIALYILTIQDCAIIKDEDKNDGTLYILQRITNTRARAKIGIMLQKRYKSCVLLLILSNIKLQLIINNAIFFTCFYSSREKETYIRSIIYRGS